MPAYNESGCLGSVVRSWLAACDGLPLPSPRLLIVDDGSRDATPELADVLAHEDERVKVLHQANAGHGAAVLTGYRRALGDGAAWVFQTDADEQMSPEDLPALWARRRADGLVVGVRAARQDPAVRLAISAGLRLVLRGLFGVSVQDANSPCRLFGAGYLAELLAQLPPALLVPNAALSALAARDGRLDEIPVRHAPRRSGQTTLVRWSLVRLCGRALGELLTLRRLAARRAGAAPGASR